MNEGEGKDAGNTNGDQRMSEGYISKLVVRLQVEARRGECRLDT
jgi:hypothetical protein